MSRVVLKFSDEVIYMSSISTQAEKNEEFFKKKAEKYKTKYIKEKERQYRNKKSSYIPKPKLSTYTPRVNLSAPISNISITTPPTYTPKTTQLAPLANISTITLSATPQTGETIFPQICDADNNNEMVLLGKGMETSGKGDGVFLYKPLNYVYKIMPKTSPPNIGAWSKRLQITIQTGGVTPEVFKKMCDRYKKADELGLGPKYYGCYECSAEKKYVIVMEYIVGKTVSKAKNDRIGPFKWSAELNKKFEVLKKKLEDNNIIDKGIAQDTHDDNFILTPNGRLVPIDF